jgi:two-component system, NtrC family, sensor histidine kinase HydH
MQRGIDQLLQRLEKLTAIPQLSGLGQLDELPQIILEHFKLEAVGLKLFHFLHRGRRSIKYPPDARQDVAVTGRRLQQVVNTGRPLTSGALRIYPLVVYDRVVGIFWLAGDFTPVGEAELSRVTQAVGGLLESAERKFVRRSRYLATISRRLHAAGSIAALVVVLKRGLLRYNRTTAVALRPLYAGTVLGGSCLDTIPGVRTWRPVCASLEEDFSSGMLTEKASLTLLQLPDQHLFPPQSQPNMVLMSLVTGGRQIGVMTLFGGDWAIQPGGTIDLLDQEFLHALAEETAHCLDQQLARERLNQLLEERLRKLHENSTLYRINRAIQSTLRLNKLTHLILSALTVSEGGGFERALLFMLNERSETLQGMLGISRQKALLMLPEEKGAGIWDAPCLADEVLQAQTASRLNRRTLKQRVSINIESPLSRSIRSGKVELVPDPGKGAAAEQLLAETLDLAPYACVPLLGKNRQLGVLVIDNPLSRQLIAVDQVRFLELFAALAASAIENSMLLSRLEDAHHELIDTQEKLIQGERLAVLGEMSASVAHELKNPLVVIGGFARRLAGLQDSGPLQQEYAEIIARETSRMEEMLSQILAFSKQQILCMEPCSLEAIVEDAIDVAADALRTAGARLIREPGGSLPKIVADHQKLRQVLVNLIINACQVTRPGGEIWLRTRKSGLHGDEAVEVDIEDSGGGIPPEVLRNIFNPFFTTRQEGTGLGLAIAQRIVAHHRGEIEVYNTKLGARFTLRVPVRQNPRKIVDNRDDVG